MEEATYYERNKEKLREDAIKYYHENKEKFKEKKKDYYEKNKKKFIENQKIYREKNKTKILEKNREKINCECGAIICRSSLNSHKKTKKHLKAFLEN